MPSWLSLYYEEPLELVSGKGCVVTDAEGRDYLDFFGGILTTMTGHAVPEVVEAIREQAGRLLHTSTLYLIRPMVELAEKIAVLSTIPDAKVFFVSSGTEANEAALLFCCRARRSNQVLALRNSYHGRSFTAMSVTGNRSWSASSLSPLQVSYLHNGDRQPQPVRPPRRRGVQCGLCRGPAPGHRHDDRRGRGLHDRRAHPGGGRLHYPARWVLRRVEASARRARHPVHLRRGANGLGPYRLALLGFPGPRITPDLLTFAKGLGNGMAIAGVVGRGDLVDSLQAASISTFGGNPLATTAALANLDYLLPTTSRPMPRWSATSCWKGFRPSAERSKMVGESAAKAS